MQRESVYIHVNYCARYVQLCTSFTNTIRVFLKQLKRFNRNKILIFGSVLPFKMTMVCSDQNTMTASMLTAIKTLVEICLYQTQVQHDEPTTSSHDKHIVLVEEIPNVYLRNPAEWQKKVKMYIKSARCPLVIIHHKSGLYGIICIKCKCQGM